MSTFNNPQQTWNQRLAAERCVFGQAPNAYLHSQAAHLTPGNALVVADDVGRNGVWLAEEDLQIDTFDFSDSAIRKAQALAQSRQVTVN
jgi:hydrogenase maturation factor